jgi:threonine dehydrogenase-like Zn-dependent dehydrogenase
VRKVLGIKDWNGAFAEYLTLPAANLHSVPDQVSDDAAVFTEPLAAALEILEQVHIQPSDKVLVIGAGRLGQMIAQVLSLTGCDLRVVTRYSYQRAILEDRQISFLAEGAVGFSEMDVVVEATGSPGGFELARQAVRPRGTIVLKSTYAGKMGVNFSSIVVDEITLVGSRCGPFPPAVGLLEKQQVDPTPLISAIYPLHQGLEAFDRAGQPGIIKVILDVK